MWRWEGGDKEQSSVVSATDNERSVWLAVILLVWIRRPRLIPGSWPLSCCSAFLFSARSLHLLGSRVRFCETGFSRPSRTALLTDCWLIGSKQKTETWSHLQVSGASKLCWSLTHLSVQYKHEGVRAVMVRGICHRLLSHELLKKRVSKWMEFLYLRNLTFCYSLII